MRSELKSSGEIFVGIFVLVLAGSLCGALVVHSQGEASKLFEIAPEYSQGRQVEEAAAAALPRLDSPDWSEARDVRTFTKDTLYEKINGRADIYFEYNFKLLTFAKYVNAQAPDDDIQVYVYDMAESENAMGIYKAELSEYAEPAEVGREAYRSGPSVFFWKGPMYVSVMAFEPSLADICLTLAQQLADTIEDSEQLHWSEVLFPKEDMTSEGLQYKANNVFGFEFLNEVYLIEYSGSQGRARLFAHQATSASAAEQLLQTYVASFREYGEVLREEDQIVIGDAGGVIDAVFCVGRYLAGVSEAKDATAAGEEATRFRANVRRVIDQLP
jgi:hypothetical protein